MTDANPQPAAPQPAAQLTTAEDNQWGSFAHLGGILWILPSLIIWLVFKDRGAFTNVEAKEALNFQITVTIAYLISNILTFVFIGYLLIPLVFIASVIFSIIGFTKAKDGNHYRYPFALRLIK